MTSSKIDQRILEILSKLEEDDLYALAKTITQGLLKIKSREDAIKGILKYSSDELSILRRKALTRDVLFSYLDEKNIILKLPITKNELIDKVLELWNISGNKNQQLEIHRSETPQEVSKREEKEENSISVLAEQFSKWFYSMMNSDEFIGSEHFYPDASLKVNVYTDADCDTTEVENDPTEIVQTLLRIKMQHRLFFNPNLTNDGVQGRMNPHGLVMVLTCGTLHVQQACVGVFEQVFALARDPFCDNNWKIKNCKLNLRSKSGVIGPPSLCDSELTSSLLILPTDC